MTEPNDKALVTAGKLYIETFCKMDKEIDKPGFRKNSDASDAVKNWRSINNWIKKYVAEHGTGAERIYVERVRAAAHIKSEIEQATGEEFNADELTDSEIDEYLEEWAEDNRLQRRAFAGDEEAFKECFGSPEEFLELMTDAITGIREEEDEEDEE